MLLYVLLDGFDLGVGILFPFARSPEDRDVMMDSIAPVWDGNETWLVLGGGGLLAAFPAAYAAADAGALPAGLPDAARADPARAWPSSSACARAGAARGSGPPPSPAARSLAAFAQGLILGGFIQGVTADAGRAFAGRAFDWLTPYTLLVGRRAWSAATRCWAGPG